MEDQIRDILAKVGRLPIDPNVIGATDDLYRAGLSSLATVNVMLSIEEAFDVEFPDQLLTRRSFQSIAALADVVRSLQSHRATSP